MYFFRPSFKTALISEQLKKYFTFEVQILDDKNIRRRFRPSNYQVPVLDPPRILIMRCMIANRV